jgi:hypothetical protein
MGWIRDSEKNYPGSIGPKALDPGSGPETLAKCIQKIYFDLSF